MKTNKQEPYKHNIWVNGIIMSVFMGIRFVASPLFGWQIDTTYFIIWFTIFAIVLISANYFLYLRWKNRYQ
jgi:hypothetical protein